MSRTQRGHPFLLDVYGYSYTKNKEKANKTYWNCKYQVSMHTLKESDYERQWYEA